VGPTALSKQAGAGASPANPSTTAGPTATQSASHHGIHLRQELNQLGQALQAGNLGAAQQAFTTMSQIWQQFTSSGAFGKAGGTQATPINVSA
jgi:hypothetical protein